MRIGLLGGSFDPVHNGHMKLAKAAVKQLRLDRLYFLLSPRSPFKQESTPLSSATRLRLLSSAIKGNRRFRIAAWELERHGPAYTVSTVRSYKRKHPRHDLFFVMGSDSLVDFPRWKKPLEIVRHCKLAVGRRPGARTPRIGAAFRNTVTYLKGSFPRISSTSLREDISVRRRIRDRVPPSVASYIWKHDLYEAGRRRP